jgi:hypothetical protein
MNVLVKKSLASMLDMSMEQIDAIINMAEVFKSREINRELAMKLFNKFANKTPKEINEILEKVDKEF